MTNNRLDQAGGGRPRYGLDAPPLVFGAAGLGLVGLVLLVLAVVGVGGSVVLGWGIWAVLVGGLVAAGMSYSSLVGKIRIRDRVLARLDLRGDEQVLDLGCGSGLMMLGAAQRLPRGQATGIDLWHSRDQAGSSREQCLVNAERLGLAGRVRVVDGGMTELPFDDGSFDLVMACLAVHNLHPDARREQAITEAARVLRAGGRLVVIDIFGTRTYQRAALAAGLREVERSGFLPGLVPPGRLLTARKP